MIRHSIETCDDDLALLQARLDALTEDGARIISVLWQARRVVEEAQSAAYDARGSFVIITEREGPSILRQRPIGEVVDEVLGGEA